MDRATVVAQRGRVDEQGKILWVKAKQNQLIISKLREEYEETKKIYLRNCV